MAELVDSLVGLVAIVFIFGIPIIAIITDHAAKMKRMKIEAALREEEMEKGYAPGTYSRVFTSGKAMKDFEKKARKDEAAAEKVERANLEKGIRDLEERIANLDLIMNEKKKNSTDKD